MSLATRLTLLVTALLGVCGVAAGVAFHRAVERSLHAELQGRLDARLAWLTAALDVELEDGELQLDAPDDPPGADAAAHWQIATTDGRLLWASAGAPPDAALSRSRTVTFGAPDAPPVPPAQITAGDDTRDSSPAGAPPGAAARAGWVPAEPSELPPAADAARAAVPGLDSLRVYRKARPKKRLTESDPAFEIRGTNRGREYALRLNAAGNVLRVKDSAIDPFAEYTLSPDANRVDLVLTAQAPASEARDELSRLSRTLWSVGPLALGLTAALLALLIRWQLRPLGRMAEQAARIGPDTSVGAPSAAAGATPGAAAVAGIDPVGRSAELVRLRNAINGMIARLAEGLERERRFAADAAHELRSPLAEMRATVEVALRRPREAAEYRQALELVASDLLRLQNLILGLLRLTRGGAAGAHAHPVALTPLLRRAAAQRTSGAATPAEGPLAISVPESAEALWVLGDPELLNGAVLNVLDNAARYAPGAPPTIHVEADGPAAHDGATQSADAAATVRVTIADRGPGVPPADRERIFLPLTRLDDARTAGGPDGFGLGLAVARATARAFGGDLACRPRADGAPGAEFVFTLLQTRPEA